MTDCPSTILNLFSRETSRHDELIWRFRRIWHARWHGRLCGVGCIPKLGFDRRVGWLRVSIVSFRTAFPERLPHGSETEPFEKPFGWFPSVRSKAPLLRCTLGTHYQSIKYQSILIKYQYRTFPNFSKLFRTCERVRGPNRSKIGHKSLRSLFSVWEGRFTSMVGSTLV